MTASIKFRKFAAECQAMAKTARTAEGKASWGRLAVRWMHLRRIHRTTFAANQAPATHAP
jgi:hypothetical protein